MSEKLEKARLYEIEEAKNIPQEEKPAFHVSAPVGWINDPNGFSVFKGKVHLFYQYHPYSRDWGPMHWGHSVTEDMIRWEQLPTALAPDQEYDREGCFSGSAIEADGGADRDTCSEWADRSLGGDRDSGYGAEAWAVHRRIPGAVFHTGQAEQGDGIFL